MFDKAEQTNSDNKIFYPICKEKGCDGLLKIKINENNFTIDYTCEKNKNHKGNGIYFETFEKFYLKKKSKEICFKCKLNIENNTIYKCKKCKEIFCIDCFIYDEHIKKEISNLIISKNKCNLHQRELNSYCTECGKKICVYCLNNEVDDSIHKNHNKIYILDYMLSVNEINNLNEKIKEKKKFMEKIIDSIDEWKEKFMKKVERLKQNLRNEVQLIEKLFSNFNPFFSNYTYYKNFKDFYKDALIVKNKYLEKFHNSFHFEKLTKNLMEILFYNKEKCEPKIGVLHSVFKLKEGKTSQLTDNKYFCYSDKSQIIDIDYYDSSEDSIFYNKKSRLNFPFKIHSISFSKSNNKIYICLQNSKTVKIMDYEEKSLDEETLRICEEEIVDEVDFIGNFNKCIFLKENLAATADMNSISIWNKNNDQSANKYSKIKKIEINGNICDLLLINDNYFISASNIYENISFFDTENFEKIKVIKNIDCVNTTNCLFLISNYILVNCKEGIAIINVDTKEYVQYYKIFNNNDNKRICINDRNDIYILNNNNYSIVKMELSEGSFIVKEMYKKIEMESENDEDDEDEEGDKTTESIESHSLGDLEIIFNRNNLILYGDAFYLLKDKIV